MTKMCSCFDNCEMTELLFQEKIKLGETDPNNLVICHARKEAKREKAGLHQQSLWYVWLAAFPASCMIILGIAGALLFGYFVFDIERRKPRWISRCSLIRKS